MKFWFLSIIDLIIDLIEGEVTESDKYSDYKAHNLI